MSLILLFNQAVTLNGLGGIASAESFGATAVSIGIGAGFIQTAEQAGYSSPSLFLAGVGPAGTAEQGGFSNTSLELSALGPVSSAEQAGSASLALNATAGSSLSAEQAGFASASVNLVTIGAVPSQEVGGFANISTGVAFDLNSLGGIGSDELAGGVGITLQPLQTQGGRPVNRRLRAVWLPPPPQWVPSQGIDGLGGIASAEKVGGVFITLSDRSRRTREREYFELLAA